MARPLQSGARGGGKHPGLALVHLERAALRLLQLAHDRLADQGVVRRRPLAPLMLLGQGGLEVREEVARDGGGDEGVAQGARVPVDVERLLPSLVPGDVHDVLRGGLEGDRVDGVACPLPRRGHARLLQPHHPRVLPAGLLRLPAFAELLGDLVGLLSGDELLGQVPLVRLPFARQGKRIVVMPQRRLAHFFPALHALSLAKPPFKVNAAASKREDHRAAFHGGCFSEEVVTLARRIVEHVPLPAQGVHPCASAAGQAPSGEGHLPITTGRPLAQLEVEP
mmetsp:Transcript_100118/g.283375  ORF Transcript_100118/g.283375 Transcript_100118/m.283375 type:complete len:280 (-) Transcript_100118:444-1283(-)